MTPCRQPWGQVRSDAQRRQDDALLVARQAVPEPGRWDEVAVLFNAATGSARGGRYVRNRWQGLMEGLEHEAVHALRLAGLRGHLEARLVQTPGGYPPLDSPAALGHNRQA